MTWTSAAKVLLLGLALFTLAAAEAMWSLSLSTALDSDQSIATLDR